MTQSPSLSSGRLVKTVRGDPAIDEQLTHYQSYHNDNDTKDIVNYGITDVG